MQKRDLAPTQDINTTTQPVSYDGSYWLPRKRASLSGSTNGITGWWVGRMLHILCPALHCKVFLEQQESNLNVVWKI